MNDDDHLIELSRMTRECLEAIRAKKAAEQLGEDFHDLECQDD